MPHAIRARARYHGVRPSFPSSCRWRSRPRPVRVHRDEDVADAARTLQQQIVYNGEVLDIAFESVRTYKEGTRGPSFELSLTPTSEGTQSLAYLDASVHLAYALLRMLERWGKRQGKGEMYVRKKAKPKKKRGGACVRVHFGFWGGADKRCVI